MRGIYAFIRLTGPVPMSCDLTFNLRPRCSFFFIFVLLFTYKPSGSLWLGSIVIADIGVQIVAIVIAAHDAFFQEVSIFQKTWDIRMRFWLGF